MKKTISCFICIVIILSSFSIIPFTTYAESNSQCGESAFWSLSEDGVLTISGTGNMTTYNNSPSSLVLAPWYNQRESITSVIVEDGITSIGSHAFYDCTNITSIIIPNSVTVIERYAFYYCVKLRNITIPNGVNVIRESTFARCVELKSITIPAGVTAIERYAFSGCTGLTNITIQDGVTCFDEYSFAGCTKLKDITIPYSTTYIGICAFFCCDNLKNVYYEGSKDDQNSISIGSNNTSLKTATWHYHSFGSLFSVLGEKFNYNLSYYAKFWNSTQYNPELAHLMMTFANAAYDPVKVGQGYQDLGLSEFEPYNYFNHYSVYGTENVCYSIASTVDNDGSICLLAALRGSGSIADISQGTLDWLGNFDLGSAIETNFKPHNNFNIAANHVYNGINTYLHEKYGKTIEDGGVKYFITGHSRGAAVANLVEYKLEPKVGKQNLYGYNFAVPDTGVFSKDTNVKGFDNIFNISNLQDPVSYLPGFTVDMMFSIKQWWETGKLDNQWKKWGTSVWFGGGEIDGNAHDPEKYLDYMRMRQPLSSYTETPKVHLGTYINPFTPWKLVNYKLYATYCPVDVELIDENGKIIASVIDGVVDYHDTHVGDVFITTVDDHKMFAVPTDKNYTLKIVGSDEGTLDYYVANVDMIQEEVNNTKCFEGVSLTEGKEMASQVADYLDTNYTQLFLIDGENNRTQEILTNGQEVKPVFFDKNLLELKPDKTETLTAQSVDSYRWYSTDESVVTVDNGVVTAKAIGEANIIAETENGARAICKVEVTIPVILGDVNGDENINIYDVTTIQRYLVELETFNENQLALADTNGDGEVDIADATYLQMYLAEFDGIVLGKQTA